MFARAVVRCKNKNTFGENWHDIAQTTSRRKAGDLAESTQPGRGRVLDTARFGTRNQRARFEWRRDLRTPGRGIITGRRLLGVALSFASLRGFARDGISFAGPIRRPGRSRGSTDRLTHQSRRAR